MKQLWRKHDFFVRKAAGKVNLTFLDSLLDSALLRVNLRAEYGTCKAV